MEKHSCIPEKHSNAKEVGFQRELSEDKNAGNPAIFKQNNFNWNKLQAAAVFHAQSNMDEKLQAAVITVFCQLQNIC